MHFSGRRRGALLVLAPFCLLAMGPGPTPDQSAAGPDSSASQSIRTLPTRVPRAMPLRPPASHAARSGAPAAPPDGSYVYAISRNGTDRGTTTVTLSRRSGSGEIEFDENGYAGAARADIVGSFRYADLASDSYVATYRAPFLRTSPLGALPARGPHGGFGAPVTVRYRVAGTAVSATIDGAPGLRSLPERSPAPQPAAAAAAAQPGGIAAVFDAPFMAGVLFVPAARHRTGAATLLPRSEAFDEGIDAAPLRLVATAPRFPKTPKNDAALEIGGVGTLWFDRGTYIVHEAHFDTLNFDVRLVAYARTGLAAELPPADVTTPKPHVPSRTIEASAGDGTRLTAVVNPATSGRPRAATVLFVPPPRGTRNFSGDGPNPMYADLALAFAQRGYTVVRYDARDARPGAPGETWDDALADAAAVVQAAQSDDAVDASRVYLAGYGIGADLALALSGRGEPPVAGVVALAPTIGSYTECAKRTGALGGASSAALAGIAGHDPGALAARSRAPLFVLHPGVPVCRETRADTAAYDQKLRSANGRATIVLASDLSARFGGSYDADAPLDTQAFFPYRFDASTAAAIGDWLDNPKTSALPAAGGGTSAGASRPHAPPPPPPVGATELNGEFPNPHQSRAPSGVAPGIVLPSGMTPPPVQIDSTAAPASGEPPSPAAAPTRTP